jgi:hypothetical protein
VERGGQVDTAGHKESDIRVCLRNRPAYGMFSIRAINQGHEGSASEKDHLIAWLQCR